MSYTSYKYSNIERPEELSQRKLEMLYSDINKICVWHNK